MAPRWYWLLFVSLMLERAVADTATLTAVGGSVTLAASATDVAVGQTVTLTVETSNAFNVECTFYVGVPNSSPAVVESCVDVPVITNNNNVNITTCDVSQTEESVYTYYVICETAPSNCITPCKRAHLSQPAGSQAANGQAVKPLYFYGVSNNVDIFWGTPVLELSSEQSTQTTGGNILLNAAAYITPPVCDSSASSRCRKLAPETAPGGSVPVVGAIVTFDIVKGTGSLTAVNHNPNNSPRTNAAIISVDTDSSGTAQAQATKATAGVLGIAATLTTGSIITSANSDVLITFTGGNTNGICKVLLSPDVSEAHCGEEVRLVATALDISNNPVDGATLCFFISGQPQLQHYHPELKRICHVTDVLGSVALTFTSKLPGPLAVVAAGRNSAGIPVVCRASHVMFWGHDEHEQHHHHGERRGWWRNMQYSAAAIKQAMDGMAEASATKALLP